MAVEAQAHQNPRTALWGQASWLLESRRRPLLLGVVTALVVVVYSLVNHTLGFPLDDAWIHQDFARPGPGWRLCLCSWPQRRRLYVAALGAVAVSSSIAAWWRTVVAGDCLGKYPGHRGTFWIGVGYQRVGRTLVGGYRRALAVARRAGDRFRRHHGMASHLGGLSLGWKRSCLFS